MKSILLAFLLISAQVLCAAGFEWKPEGPAAGVVRQLLPDRSNPGRWYAVAGSDLYRSTDAGQTWKRSLHAISQVALASNQLFALGNSKLWASVDNGNSFRLVSTASFPLRKIVVNPSNPQTIYGFGLGRYDLARSDDGGKTWKAITNLPIKIPQEYQHYSFTDVLFSPFSAQTIYAGTYIEECFPFESCERGIMLSSVDGGKTWKIAENETGYPYSFHFDPLFPDRAYAFGDYDLRQLTRSGWKVMTQIALDELASVPKQPGELLARSADFSGDHISDLLRSTDSGATWKTIPADIHHTLSALGPVDDHVRTLLGGTFGGGVFRRDNTHGWTPSNSGLNSTVAGDIDVSGDHLFVLSAQALDLMAGRFFYDKSDGPSWTEFSSSVPFGQYGIINSLSADPFNPKHLIATRVKDLLVSLDAGHTWQVVHQNADKIIFHPTRKNVVYGTFVGSIYKSTDGGFHWSKLPLSGLDVERQAVDRMLVDPDQGQTLYFLSRPIFSGDGGALWRSSDDGKTVQRVGGGLPEKAWPGDMAPLSQAGAFLLLTRQGDVFSSTNRGEQWRPVGHITQGRDLSLFIRILPVDSTGEHVLALFDTSRKGVSPRIFESTDHAATWTPITSHFAPDSFVYDLVQNAAGIVFAGTSHGVYRAQ